MASQKDCPLCGGSMRLKIAEQVLQVPGNPQPIKRMTREWTCPDCDYYEDAED